MSARSAQTHYEKHSAQSYESAYFYEPGAYMKHLSDLVRKRLQLEEGTARTERRLLDIGGGTGNFTRMILKDVSATAVVVDPFLDHNDETSRLDGSAVVSFVKAPAESFKESTDNEKVIAWWRSDYHQILLKEVVHHFKTEDRVDIFRGMRQGLVGTPGLTSLLIITRPHTDIDYPLWDEAREVWAQNQPRLEDLIEELKQAGFSNIAHSLDAYPCNIELARWQAMVKARFWSTFSNFSDEQLEAACGIIEENEEGRIVEGRISFDDRLLFISADK